MAKPKVKPVKWALGGDEPDDLQDFLSNDDIVLKNTNKRTKDVLWPKKGPHTLVVKRLMVKDNKNGDPRISAMIVMQNGKKSEAVDWNGYLIWDGFNVTDQGAPYIKRFLRALGLEWSDFMNKSKQVEDGDRVQIVQIGRVKFGEDAIKDPTLKAIVKVKPADDYNDDEHMEIQRYLPMDDDADEDEDEDEDDDAEAFAEDEDEDDDSDDEAEDDEDDEDDDEDEEDDEDEDEDDEDDDDDEAELREELGDLTVANLKKRAVRIAKKAKADPDDAGIPAKKAALIDWIVQAELTDEPPF